MELATKHFGAVDVDESKIIEFSDGIFGFESLKKYVLLYDKEDEGSPFAWIQAVDDAKVCLPMINPMSWFPEYSPEIDDDLIKGIGELNQEYLNLYTVVVIPEDIKGITTNLKAPILINKRTKKGVQVIVKDEEFQIKHNLYEQLEKLKKAGE